MTDIASSLQSSHLLILISGLIILCPWVILSSKYLATPYEKQASFPWPLRSSALTTSLMAIVFIVAAYKFKSPMTLALMLFLIATLTLLALLDARLKVLPNIVTLPLLVVGLLISVSSYSAVDWSESLMGMVIGFMLLYLPAILYAKLSGRDGVGYGDFKLMAAIGAWLGWQPLLPIIFIAGVSAAIFGIIYLKINQLPRTTTIPFGPFLSGSSIVMIII